jgi:hypothetical protein
MPYTKSGYFVFDNLDLRILKIFAELNGDSLGGWKMIEMIFPESKSESEKNQNYRIMKERIKNLSGLGVIKSFKTNSGKPIWEIDGNQVLFKKIKMPNGIRKFICLLIEDCWQIMEYPI